MCEEKIIVDTIEFNKDKNIMVVSPALTSTDDSETWVHIDD